MDSVTFSKMIGELVRERKPRKTLTTFAATKSKRMFGRKGKSQVGKNN
jgi:hypothetical protein